MCKKTLEEPGSTEEKDHLKTQMSEVIDRWVTICHKSEVRRSKLDKVKKPAKSLSEKEKTLVDWLKKAEKKVKELDVVPTEGTKAHDIAEENNVSSYPSIVSRSSLRYFRQ